MSELWLPEGAHCRAVIIGADRFRSPDLPAIPAVQNNLAALQHALTHPDYGLMPGEGCFVLGRERPADAAAIGTAIAASSKALDLLLVYYAGHGLLDDHGMLHLALEYTDPDRVGYSALPLELVKKDLARARARARVLILDCCFSGQAVAAMAGTDTLLVGQLDTNGTYTLTSTTATAPSHAPPGHRYTAFTGALLRALAHPTPLTLDEIYLHVDKEMTGFGLPRPQRRATNTIDHLALTRGPVTLSAEYRPVGQTAGPPIVVAQATPAKPPSRQANYRFFLNPARERLLILAGCQAMGVFFGAAFGLLSFGIERSWLAHFLFAYFFFGVPALPALIRGTLSISSEGLSARYLCFTARLPWENVGKVTLVSRGGDPRKPEQASKVIVQTIPALRPRLPFKRAKPFYGWKLREVRVAPQELARQLHRFGPAGIHVE
ncbi:caspase, EACC1-associated type [Streptomyces sp. URMC 127]|uniref:caspase, EACC1-associated type n=1 Tax=Streptomyces sp. URMC 127 TaxID=3423402 RepID=UPI003F1C1B47